MSIARGTMHEAAAGSLDVVHVGVLELEVQVVAVAAGGEAEARLGVLVHVAAGEANAKERVRVRVKDVEDSNVVEDNVELVGTLAERFTDECGDMGTLGEELVGVELRIDGLELLGAGGGKDLRVILGAEE
jgi:hypothetical protein